MNSLNFENRVSLNKKSEELTKIVEELSSSYEKREGFVLINPHVAHTSEIGIFVGVALIAVLAAGVLLGVYFLMVCWSESVPCFAYTTVDSIFYKNIV